MAARKNAKGSGTIRKKTVTRNGKDYTYWEARVTTGRDPGTGKQVQRSFTGKTQKEVREKMQAAAVEVNQGTYTAPQRLTVGEWLDIWSRDYLGDVKPRTAEVYKGSIKNHLKPGLGAVRLADLRPDAVQRFVNALEGLAPASVRLHYKVLHMALEKAVALDYVPRNPGDRCVLPKLRQEEVRPLDDAQAAALLEAAKGGELENMIAAALFTGLRLSELLGLTWGAVDFTAGTVTVDKQLAPTSIRKAAGLFQAPKNGKTRTLRPAGWVFEVLRRQRVRQAEQQLRAGPVWSNPSGLIFTAADGGPWSQTMVEKRFKGVRTAAGLEHVRFHDLRHTYAVNAIRAGDDIKTIQGNLGHSTAAFTLDRYAHFTESMKQDSAARMEDFIKNTIGL